MTFANSRRGRRRIGERQGTLTVHRYEPHNRNA